MNQQIQPLAVQVAVIQGAITVIVAMALMTYSIARILEAWREIAKEGLIPAGGR